MAVKGTVISFPSGVLPQLVGEAPAWAAEYPSCCSLPVLPNLHLSLAGHLAVPTPKQHLPLLPPPNGQKTEPCALLLSRQLVS